MQTTADRLQWAVRFATLDLDHLRPGDWLNLRDDLRSFIRGANTYIVLDPQEPSKEALRALQQDVLAVLTAMSVRREDEKDRDNVLTTPVDLQLELSVLYIGPPRGQKLPMLMRSGNWRAQVLWRLSDLLGDMPTDSIRACPACGTIFYRVRKQQYCSTRCVKRESMRKWRQTETGKQYERDRTRARYQARQKRRLGPNVKVGRRRSTQPTQGE